MRVLTDKSWSRRGVALLWSGPVLVEIAAPAEVVTIRRFFDIAHRWPEDLPSNGGKTLVVAGLEGCLDALTPQDAEKWLRDRVRDRILSFQDEYEGQAGLVFWLPRGEKRIKLVRSADAHLWQCAPPFRDRLPIGRLLWGGAESDAGHILNPREKNQDPDGPAWVGLHHPRIS